MYAVRYIKYVLFTLSLENRDKSLKRKRTKSSSSVQILKQSQTRLFLCSIRNLTIKMPCIYSSIFN